MDNGILFGILLLMCLISSQLIAGVPVNDDEYNQTTKDCKDLCGECGCIGFYCGEECLCECEKQSEEESQCIASMADTCEKKKYPFEVLIQGPDSNRLTRRSMMYNPSAVIKSPEDVCVNTGPIIGKPHRSTISIYKPIIITKKINENDAVLDVKSFINEIGTQLAEKLHAETLKYHQQNHDINEGIKIREITPKQEHISSQPATLPVAKIREVTKGINNEIIKRKRSIESVQTSKTLSKSIIDTKKKTNQFNTNTQSSGNIASVLFPFEMKTIPITQEYRPKPVNKFGLSHVPATAATATTSETVATSTPALSGNINENKLIKREIKKSPHEIADSRDRQLTATDALALLSLADDCINKRKRETANIDDKVAAAPLDTSIDTLAPESSIDAVVGSSLQAKRDAVEESVAISGDGESVAMAGAEDVAMFGPTENKFDLGSSLKKLLFFDGINKLGFSQDKKLVDLLKAEVLMDIVKGVIDFDKLGLSTKKFDFGDLVKFAKFDGFGLDKLGLPGIDLAKFGLEKLKLEALGLEKFGLTKLAKLDLLGKKIDLGGFLIGKKILGAPSGGDSAVAARSPANLIVQPEFLLD